MLSRTALRATRALTPAARPFTSSAMNLAEKDVDAVRTTYGSDKLSDRGNANEDLFIKQEERAKLRSIKEKLEAQKKHMDELMTHVNEAIAQNPDDQKKK